jgi:hypothetical protein
MTRKISFIGKTPLERDKEEIIKEVFSRKAYFKALDDFEEELYKISFSEYKERNILIKREIFILKLGLQQSFLLNRKVFKQKEVK